jgi:hypothetical protein
MAADGSARRRWAVPLIVTYRVIERLLAPRPRP